MEEEFFEPKYLNHQVYFHEPLVAKSFDLPEPTAYPDPLAEQL
jgi:hypothetical protein